MTDVGNKRVLNHADGGAVVLDHVAIAEPAEGHDPVRVDR